MKGSSSTRTSFFLHIHPERVYEASLATTATFGLGVLASVLLVVLTVTGIALMFHYVPEPDEAYSRVVELAAGPVAAASLVRDIHRIASDALVIVLLLHMTRVFLTGALGFKRRLNWNIGLALLLTTLATAFTGFLLPWDRNAYWAATVGGELFGAIPWIGGALRGVLWGGDSVSADTVVRAYALHVAALPAIGGMLLGAHLFRIRKAGGLARAPESRGELRPSRPALTVRELIIALFACSALLVAAMVWDAPIGPPGHPPQPMDPTKAPWFLLWMQELVSYSTFFGGLMPILTLFALALWPFAERRPSN